jgi:hypothetical protein
VRRFPRFEDQELPEFKTAAALKIKEDLVNSSTNAKLIQRLCFLNSYLINKANGSFLYSPIQLFVFSLITSKQNTRV